MLGLDALAPADVVIIVDVLSFSTCVDIAVGRGALIFPIQWDNVSAREVAEVRHAELAGRRGQLKEKGYEVDVELASQLNASNSVPVLQGNAFTNYIDLSCAQ